jgi:hypothetical protein
MKSIKQLKLKYGRANLKTLLLYTGILSTGLVIGYAHGQTSRQPPSEHEGVSVVALGTLKESSLEIQIGMDGYQMQLREVTVAPGGAMTEVRNGKEIEFPATKKEALVEDENTVHWLYNDGDVPAVAVVCGLSKVTQ